MGELENEATPKDLKHKKNVRDKRLNKTQTNSPLPDQKHFNPTSLTDPNYTLIRLARKKGMR